MNLPFLCALFHWLLLRIKAQRAQDVVWARVQHADLGSVLPVSYLWWREWMGEQMSYPACLTVPCDTLQPLLASEIHPFSEVDRLKSTPRMSGFCQG